MLLKDFCEELDRYYAARDFKDACPNGLQVEGGAQVKSAATAVTASLATIRRAVALGVDALIVHHGLFWQGDSYRLIGSKKERIALLLHHGISLIAYHLPMDAHLECGNNWRAAKEMGWFDLAPFGEYNGQIIGVKGRVNSLGPRALQAKLEEYYAHPAQCAFGGKEEIQTIALVSGGAYKSLSEAAFAGIDSFITGNYDEPAWHIAHEERVHFYALGHSATERVGPRALALEVTRKFAMPCAFIDDANPF